MENGKVVRGWLGVQIQPVTEEIASSIGLDKARGAMVTEPQDNSPAAKAGIKSGDTILSVNGQDVEDAKDLARKIAAYPPKTTVDVTLWRDGKEKDVKVDLGELPNEQAANAQSNDSGDADHTSLGDYGLTLAPAAAAGAGDNGAVITDIDPNGKAADRGLKEGDVILEAGGQTIAGPHDVSKALTAAEKAGKKAILLRVKSGDSVRFLALPLGK